jgi:hypothetical protein
MRLVSFVQGSTVMMSCFDLTKSLSTWLLSAPSFESNSNLLVRVRQTSVWPRCAREASEDSTLPLVAAPRREQSEGSPPRSSRSSWRLSF